MNSAKFSAGDRVFVIGYESEGTRTIAAILDSVIAGGVRLDKPVSGLRYWNVNDLKHADGLNRLH